MVIIDGYYRLMIYMMINDIDDGDFNSSYIFSILNGKIIYINLYIINDDKS